MYGDTFCFEDLLSTFWFFLVAVFTEAMRLSTSGIKWFYSHAGIVQQMGSTGHVGSVLIKYF